MSPSPEPPLAGPSSAGETAPGQPHPQIPLQGPAQSTAPGAQRPTLTNTHIRSVVDAQKLFYAVQCGLLPKVERRLDAVERKRLRPGDVYVWEERGATGLFAGAPGGVAVVAKEGMAGAAEAAGYEVGIERWTEGLSWSASRIRDEFLIYFENVKKKERGVDREGHRARSLENQVLREGDRDMYIKQTYSVLRLDVNQDEGPTGASTSAAGEGGDKKDVKKKPRKWHLNAYFTKSTEGNLNTIDTIPWLRDLEVPEGIFTSARQSKKTSGGGGGGGASSSSTTSASTSTSQPKLEAQGDETSSLGKRSRAAPAPQRTYAAFPTGERRPHPRPVVPAPPPPPPPLPPGAAPSDAQPMASIAEEAQGAHPSTPGLAQGSMHVLVPGRTGSTVQTVPLEPIDTTRMTTGGAASPASAGGVHVSTVGLYRMHLGEGGDDQMHTDAPEHAGAGSFGPSPAFGGPSTFGDVGSVGRPFGQGGLPSQLNRGGLDVGHQQQLRELQRYQERQHAQQREQLRLHEQQQNFYGAGTFDFDASHAFQHPHTPMQQHASMYAHSHHHLQAPSQLYSPLQPTLHSPHGAQPHSPVHNPMSPALSDFRASSEFSQSSSSSSSRGGSVSSGSGSVHLLGAGAGAWGAPAPAEAPAPFEYRGYAIKNEYSEFSELHMALYGAGSGAGAGGAEGVFGAGAGEGPGDGEDESEDLSGYRPMPPLPAALTEPAEDSAGRRRAAPAVAARRAAPDAARRGEQRVDVAGMSGLAIQAFEGFEDVDGDYYGVAANGTGSGLSHPNAQSSSSSLIDALSMSTPSRSAAISPPAHPSSHGPLSPGVALPSVPSVPTAPLSVPSIPSVPSVPPQPITMPSVPHVSGADLPPPDAGPAEGTGKGRRALAPLHQLQRAHPYRTRNRLEERALRMLGSAPAPLQSGCQAVPRGLAMGDGDAAVAAMFREPDPPAAHTPPARFHTLLHTHHH